MKCLFLYQKQFFQICSGSLFLPPMAFLVMLLLLSYSITFSPLNWIIPINMQVCIIQNSLNSTSFSIYCLIFLLLITVKHLREVCHPNCNRSSPLSSFFSPCQSFFCPHHSTGNCSCQDYQPPRSCQIQSYFSVFIWFYLSISFNIMSYSLIRVKYFLFSCFLDITLPWLFSYCSIWSIPGHFAGPASPLQLDL